MGTSRRLSALCLSWLSLKASWNISGVLFETSVDSPPIVERRNSRPTRRRSILILGVDEMETPEVSPFSPAYTGPARLRLGALLRTLLWLSPRSGRSETGIREEQVRPPGLDELHRRDIVRPGIAHPADPGSRACCRGPIEQATATSGARQEHGLVRAK